MCAVGPSGQTPCSGHLASQQLRAGMWQGWKRPTEGLLWEVQGRERGEREAGRAVLLGTHTASASTLERSKTISRMDPGSKILLLSQV